MSKDVLLRLEEALEEQIVIYERDGADREPVEKAFEEVIGQKKRDKKI
jgi:hypothetical protein